MARSSVSPLVAAFETTLKFIAILFAVELVDVLFGLGLDRYGIRPRNQFPRARAARRP